MIDTLILVFIQDETQNGQKENSVGKFSPVNFLDYIRINEGQFTNFKYLPNLILK